MAADEAATSTRAAGSIQPDFVAYAQKWDILRVFWLGQGKLNMRNRIGTRVGCSWQ